MKTKPIPKFHRDTNCCLLFSLLLIAVAINCSQSLGGPRGIDVSQAMERIKPEAIWAQVEFLSDDLLESRGTGTRGDKLGANYIRAKCMVAGLRGGADNNEFFQIGPS